MDDIIVSHLQMTEFVWKISNPEFHLARSKLKYEYSYDYSSDKIIRIWTFTYHLGNHAHLRDLSEEEKRREEHLRSITSTFLVSNETKNGLVVSGISKSQFEKYVGIPSAAWIAENRYV